MVALDILEALRRAITLPKARNSLSDLLGSHDPLVQAAAVAVTTTIHNLLADAIASGVHVLVSTAEKDLEHARQFLADQITHSLSGVSPQLAAEVLAVVTTQVTSAEQIVEANAVALSNALLADLAKLLKTS